MVWLKSCPGCERGDLMLEEERDGCKVKCLQCGYTTDVEHPILAGLSLVVNEAGLLHRLTSVAATEDPLREGQP